MGEGRALLLLVLVVCYALVATVGGYEDEGRRRRREREEGQGEGEKTEGEDFFLLQNSKRVVKTDAGDMRVVRGWGGRIMERRMQIGFITMEPRSLFIPQYLDCSLILFIRRGEARVGHIYKDEMVERRLKTGDVYRISAGSAFYLENTAEGQKLHCICSLDTSESLGWNSFQSFFVGGGSNPTSILAGFDPQTLSAAFNVSESEIREILTRQQAGAIVYLHDSQRPTVWTQFVKQHHHERKAHLKRIVLFEEEASQGKEQELPTWSLRKLLISVLGMENKIGEDGSKKGPDSYNIYHRRPDYKNNYGCSMAIDESDYSPLRHSGMGIYLVNLTAGSMMAPHVNPTATEYGIVLRGTGRIQIVYPNGTLAMNAKVREGDVFWVPRYFPFCQIASRGGPFEFFGFTTSARRNRPQFLAGANSLLQTMKGSETAEAFGISEERLKKIIDAQREAVILPSPTVAPPATAVELEEEEMGRVNLIPRMINNFGNGMIMGFD
ncbi:unnamed protein product [Ilex paraguariensis]|uniref:Cupin type-1 domain-containing protein n=1 Tax=Ilex paraguariensis TaxID=185542 RepID=A0ABC8RG85_9AQUA